MIKIKQLLTQTATELPLKEWSDQEAFAKEQKQSMIYKDISNTDKDYPYLLFLDGGDI